MNQTVKIGPRPPERTAGDVAVTESQCGRLTGRAARHQLNARTARVVKRVRGAAGAIVMASGALGGGARRGDVVRIDQRTAKVVANRRSGDPARITAGVEGLGYDAPPQGAPGARAARS